MGIRRGGFVRVVEGPFTGASGVVEMLDRKRVCIRRSNDGKLAIVSRDCVVVTG